MKLAFLTAGAAGMYCGSCMRDNTLVSALLRRGEDAVLIPTYLPIRTDEEDVSTKAVQIGGINVYLEEHSWVFRHTPRWVDRAFNVRRLLTFVSRYAVRTRTDTLGALTISMLRGTEGRQVKEVVGLLEYLQSEIEPDILLLSNVLLSGIVPLLKEKLQIPILGYLQGDDIFLEGLPPADRHEAIALIRRNCEHLDGLICTCASYADFMAGYLGIPRSKMQVVYPGIKLEGFDAPRVYKTEGPFAIGYFARICTEKGLHQLVDAYIRLRRMPNVPDTRLLIGGWLGENNRPFFDAQMRKLADAGLAEHVAYRDCPGRADKLAFLREVDLFSVPTVYREPKGLYLLEAWASGLPVVQPAHGSFPELVAATGGGLLTTPDVPEELARGLYQMLIHPEKLAQYGRQGREAVMRDFSDEVMATRTLETLSPYMKEASV